LSALPRPSWQLANGSGKLRKADGRTSRLFYQGSLAPALSGQPEPLTASGHRGLGGPTWWYTGCGKWWLPDRQTGLLMSTGCGSGWASFSIILALAPAAWLAACYRAVSVKYV